MISSVSDLSEHRAVVALNVQKMVSETEVTLCCSSVYWHSENDVLDSYAREKTDNPKDNISLKHIKKKEKL